MFLDLTEVGGAATLFSDIFCYKKLTFGEFSSSGYLAMTMKSQYYSDLLSNISVDSVCDYGRLQHINNKADYYTREFTASFQCFSTCSQAHPQTVKL